MIISLLQTAQGVWTSNQQLFFAFVFNLTVKKKNLIVKTEIQIFCKLCSGIFYFLHFIVSYNAFELIIQEQYLSDFSIHLVTSEYSPICYDLFCLTCVNGVHSYFPCSETHRQQPLVCPSGTGLQNYHKFSVKILSNYLPNRNSCFSHSILTMRTTKWNMQV